MVADATITTCDWGSGYIAVPAIFTIEFHKNGITAFTINAWLQGIANIWLSCQVVFLPSAWTPDSLNKRRLD
ncbi:hypothetical protein E2562_038146 [Oryza meyeriana var. granulata]|uniref:Uncharacterized protein n=1 Tax=Oryza meyeriana var. granulata TaxID=110450 RepID=A0A6G1DAY0_9ORYZ|nr:hypothetical protein E2562_038146 [Oryza meyeriana var. granulata]